VGGVLGGRLKVKGYPGSWYLTPDTQEIVENIGANLYNMVHFGDIRSSKVGRKIDAFPSEMEFTAPAI